MRVDIAGHSGTGGKLNFYHITYLGNLNIFNIHCLNNSLRIVTVAVYPDLEFIEARDCRRNRKIIQFTICF